jgi:sugar fermentation stimulation protein A
MAFTPGLDFGRYQAGHHVRFAYTNLIGFRKRWNASRVACGAGKADAFSSSLEEARLIRRYKRFLADIETVTGEFYHSLPEHRLDAQLHGGRWAGVVQPLQRPQAQVAGYWKCRNPQGRLACVNTARANPLIEEALRAGVIVELDGFTALKREVAYGQENSRIDFRLDYPSGAAYVEVKSVTLGFDGSSVAAFPMR